MNNQLSEFFETKKKLFYHLTISSLSKMIAISSLYIYAKILTKDEIGQIAFIQAIIVFLVAIISIQIPGSVFRYSLEKKYQNTSFWITQKSSYFFYISLFLFFSSFFYTSFIIQALLLCLIQICAQTKLELVRTSSNKNEYFVIIFFQVFFSVLLTSITLFLYNDIFNGVLVYIFFEYLSWAIVLFICSRNITKIKKEKKIRSQLIKKYLIDHLKYGLYLIPTTFAWAIILYGPLVLTKFFFNAEVVAKFAISNRMPQIIFILGVLIIQVIGKNLILDFQKNSFDFCRKFFKYCFYWFVYCLSLSIIIYFINYFIILNIFPSYQITKTGQFLQFLNAFLLSNFSFIGFFYQVRKSLKYNAISSTLTAIIGVIFGFIFGSFYGLEGILIGMTLGLLIGLILRYIEVSKFIYEKLSKKNN